MQLHDVNKNVHTFTLKCWFNCFETPSRSQIHLFLGRAQGNILRHLAKIDTFLQYLRADKWTIHFT